MIVYFMASYENNNTCYVLFHDKPHIFTLYTYTMTMISNEALQFLAYIPVVILHDAALGI